MTLAVMALYAQGTTRLDNIASWRVKETDRIAAMAAELRKVGATVTEGPDLIEVTPPAAWQAGRIHTYDDHRMAMCLSLAAFNVLAGAQPPVPVRIEDPKCVAKTFPDYFETLFGVVSASVSDIPVITIDGPTASGKGTLADEVAQERGERDKVHVDGEQHQLDRHHDDDQVLPVQEDAEDAEREQARRDGQVMAETDSHPILPRPTA